MLTPIFSVAAQALLTGRLHPSNVARGAISSYVAPGPAMAAWRHSESAALDADRDGDDAGEEV